jgi:hypothetical protein
MLNPRILIASAASFILILATFNYVTNTGYDKVMPKLEERKQKVIERQKLFSEYIQEDLEDIGASTRDYETASVPQVTSDYPGAERGSIARRPVGTWMGVKRGDEANMAVMRFDKQQYWLLIKDPMAGEITEKGRYDFQFDSIRFKPEDGEPYLMNYYMISGKGIQLYGYDYSFNFEKAENISLDF